MLAPTLRLASRISDACAMIGAQTRPWATFTNVQTDPLTGVCNRRGLDDALAAQFAGLDRYEVRFSVVIFDLDHFKRINDKGGLLKGDQLLKRAASLLDETARQTDVVARCGGGEFVVVMPETDLVQASIFAERFRARVERELAVTMSGGIASVLDGDTPDSLLARTDAALYAAKLEGGNCLFRHDGRQIESIWEEVPASPC
jgi:diguanylate cyclase (GGDEF)-like protein